MKKAKFFQKFQSLKDFFLTFYCNDNIWYLNNFFDELNMQPIGRLPKHSIGFLNMTNNAS